MNILGLTVTRTKEAIPLPVLDNRGAWFRVFESYPGAWQQGVTVDRNTILTWHAIYSCITLIASDIAKLAVCLKKQTEDGVWVETTNSAYSPVLRKPNSFQNRIQFWENWMMSKLSRGNTYVLKERDNRGVVVRMYILDPNRVTPLVAPDGSVFYRLNNDNIVGLEKEETLPASEIIHDRYNCLFHPLVGTSPIVACGVAAVQGMAIQTNQTNFFNNQSMPGGILSAPGEISDETAGRLKTAWATNYTGANAGKVAVLGDGLDFKKIALTSVEAQMIDQLKWTAEVACSVFHVPGYKIGLGTLPTGATVQSLNLEYYSQALQRLIEDAELCMDEGLGLSADLGAEFDIDNLLRMDSVSQMEVLDKAAGKLTIDEIRKKLGYGKTPGGNTVYLQQQNFSLEALAKRDALPDPFTRVTSPVPTPASEVPGDTSADPSADTTADPAASKRFDFTAKALEAALAARS